MNLFLDSELTFEKLGYEARLSEDMNNWPQEIIDQLYKQAPFASDFAPKVVLDKVDPDKRYAMGHVELKNALAINPRDDNTPTELRGQQKVLIPVVIKDGKMAPMDLLLNNGTVEPLTEERLRRALFRPTLFEAIRQRPGDQTLIDQIYPPFRSYGGGRGPMGGPLISESVGSKLSSARPEMLLDAIIPTLKKAHVEHLETLMNDNPALHAGLVHNPMTLECLQKVAHARVQDEPSGRDYMAQVFAAIPPTVVQIQKIAGGFRIKTANPEMMAPETTDVDRPTAQKAVGSDVISKVEQDGTQTFSTTPAIRTTLEDATIKTVSEFGLYKVKDLSTNKELVGWVFPSLTDFDGVVHSLALFSNGSQSAMQEEIAGIPVDRSTDVLEAEPQGFGCFYKTSPGGAVAMIPVQVKGASQTPDNKSFFAELPTGEQLQLSLVPGLKTLSQMGENQYGLPEDMKFMPVTEQMAKLAPTPEQFLKTAQAWGALSKVQMITDGNTFSFRGPALDKVSSIHPTQFLDRDEALFLGVCLGHDVAEMKEKIAEAESTQSRMVMLPVRPITTMREKVAEARAHVQKTLASFPDLRADLFKEAAVVEDPSAVDKILSVGFITPENVSIFASYIPEIESAIKKLSELLLASRLGLSSVSEGALQKATIHLDKVVAGLRSLAATPQA